MMVLLTQNLYFVCESEGVDSEIKALRMALMMPLFQLCVEVWS